MVKVFYAFKNKKNVKFVHIKAHTGKQDIHSIGNDKADELANKAIGVNSCPYQLYKKTVIYNHHILMVL